MQLASKAAVALLLLSGSLISAKAAETPLPAAIAAPGETVVLSVHAEGAQVYECKLGADGKLGWAFREPIATLLADGKTIGHHYVGPRSIATAAPWSARPSAMRRARRKAIFPG